jgi:hypothetical protein
MSFSSSHPFARDKYLYNVGLEILNMAQMSSIFIDLSSCILFAVLTLGSLGRIGFLPPKRPLARAAESPARVLS